MTPPGDSPSERSRLGQKTCGICGAPLASLAERSEGVCRKLKCVSQNLTMRKRKAEQNARLARRRVCEAADAQLRTSNALPAEVLENSLLMVVPYTDREVEEVSEDRRSAFKQHLETIFLRATQMYEDAQNHIRYRDFATYSRQSAGGWVVDNACATCRGYCCQAGENTGLLNADFILWRLIDEPELSPEAMMQQYLEHLPSESMAGSCIFHSPSGCTMDRSIRAPTCNEFLCDSFADDQQALAEQPNAASVAVAKRDGEASFRRIGVIDPAGNRTETELP